MENTRIVKSEFCAEYNEEMHCPFCGAINIHVDGVSRSENGKESVISIKMWCESKNSHRWSFDLMDYKGTVYVRNILPGEVIHHPQPTGRAPWLS